MEQPVQRIPLSGRPDNIAILEVLENLTTEFARNPTVYRAALDIIGRTKNNDQHAQIDRLTRFVREKMIYVQDPIGSEFVTQPDTLLQQIARRGYGQGDCDDHVLLLNSLLGAVGLETRFAGVKLPKSPIFNHVVSNVKWNGKWFEIDPCSKRGTLLVFDERLTVK